MLRANVPPSFPIPFASSAGGSFIRPIPQASQIGIINGAASLTDGFVPLNFSPVAAGGVPPFGEDFNGILNQITLWNQWTEAGAPVSYNSAFSTGINGYPQGAILQSVVTLGKRWMSTVDNNTTDPDFSGAANWVGAPGDVPTGTPLQSLTSTLPYGYVAANGLTIGNGSSNATGRANADTQFLYAFNWLNFSNSACPIYTSTGSASTRGANPAADFAANKALAMPSMQGLELMGVDTMGGGATTFLNGVPVGSGGTTTPGSVLGENLHQLSIAELAAHTHGNFLSDPSHLHNYLSNLGGAYQGGGTAGGAAQVNNNTAAAVTGTTLTNASVGSSSSHNTVHRSMLVFWGQKL